MYVDLYHKQGFLIATVELPEIEIKPDVVIWGPKTFVLNKDSDIYSEAVVVTALSGPPPRKVEEKIEPISN